MTRDKVHREMLRVSSISCHRFSPLKTHAFAHAISSSVLTIVMKLEIANKLDILIYRRLLWVDVASD